MRQLGLELAVPEIIESNHYQWQRRQSNAGVCKHSNVRRLEVRPAGERVRIAHEREFKCALNDASVAIVVMVAHHCYNAPFRDELR